MDSLEIQRSSSKSATQSALNNLSTPSCGECSARKLSLCGALDDDQVKDIADLSKNQSIKANQMICREGEAANYIYIIQSGSVRVFKMLGDGRRQIVFFLFPTDCFGLAGLEKYGYTIETITEVKLCRMPKNQLLAKLNDLPTLPHKILEITRTSLQFSIDQILLLGQKKANEKLCSFLLQMAEKTSNVDNKVHGLINLPMCRSDIADYLGVTKETVSRQFTILSKDRVISLFDNASIKIIDLDRLKLIASGG